MRSGRIQEEDTVVLVEGYRDSEPGSSFKAREVTRTHVAIDDYWDSTYEERMMDPNSVVRLRRGTEVVSCREAAKRGIEPWATAFSLEGTAASLERAKVRRESADYVRLDILNPGGQR